jgi:hypothetical protein
VKPTHQVAVALAVLAVQVRGTMLGPVELVRHQRLLAQM